MALAWAIFFSILTCIDCFSAKELTFASFGALVWRRLVLFLLTVASITPFSSALAKKELTRKDANAPVVDSYLLRILSLNKKQRQKLSEEDNPSILRRAFRKIEAPHKTAKSAAISVESLAIDRHTKRQWRRFLKDREEWLEYPPLVAQPTPQIFSVDQDLQNAERVIDTLLSYGLSGRDIVEIMIHTPQVAFISPDDALRENLDRVFCRLLMGREHPRELGMRRYDARRILRKAPGLLTGAGSKAAEGMIDLMLGLGASKSSLKWDKQALTILLQRQPAAVFRLVAFLSSDAVRMPVSSIGPLLRRTACRPLLDAVASHELPEDELSRQLQRAVVDDLYSRMSRTASTLRYELGAGDLTNVIASFPGVLLLDADRHILPMANYLMNELGMYEYDLPRILRLYPVVLRMDLEQLQNVVQYFLSLDVPQERLGVIIRSFPALLTMDIEHDMEPVVTFLRDEIGINNVGRFISRLPPVLGYSVTHDLRPKYQFLSSVVTDPLFEVSKFPAFFSYPLERAVLRYAYLRKKRKLLVPLDEVVRFGDFDFCQQVAGDKDTYEYIQFANERRERVKKAILKKTQAIDEEAADRNSG